MRRRLAVILPLGFMLALAIVALGPASSSGADATGTVAGTYTTTGCAATAPLWHVLYRVWEVGGDGTQAPTSELVDSEAAAADIATSAGVATHCALRLAVTVVDMGTNVMYEYLPAASPNFDVVIDRAPDFAVCPASTAQPLFHASDAYEGNNEAFTVEDACGVGFPIFVGSANPAFSVAQVLSEAHAAYGLPARRWAAPQQFHVVVGFVDAPSIIVPIDSVTRGEAFTATMTNSQGRVVAKGRLAIPAYSSSTALLPLPSSLAGGTYHVCVTTTDVGGRWLATRHCVWFRAVGASAPLLHGTLNAQQLVLTATGALRGQSVTVTFWYIEPQTSCGGPPCTLGIYVAKPQVRLNARTVVAAPPGWAERLHAAVTVSTPSFRVDNIRYAALSVSYGQNGRPVVFPNNPY